MARLRGFFTTVLLDSIAIAAIGLPVLYLFISGETFWRGFYCNDESIRYPYRESTIPNYLLYIINIGLVAVTIIVTECVLFSGGFKLIKENLNFALLMSIYKQLVPYILGALSSQLLTDIAKYKIGRLRPHFIDVCKPTSLEGSIDYTSDCSEAELYKYIEKYKCNGDAKLIHDSRLSFMSGHSSFSAFSMVYLAIYLQYQLSNKIGFFKPLSQVALITLAIYTGFTRISDYKHHWSDVLIGLLQGTIVAILSARFFASFTEKKTNEKYSNNDSSVNIGM